MIRRLFNAFLLWRYRSKLECVVSERATYQAAMPDKLGPNYLANCETQERMLRGRIAYLESGL